MKYLEKFLVLGHDNVSSSIGFALFVFGAKPEFQDKVYEELHTVLGKLSNYWNEMLAGKQLFINEVKCYKLEM